MNAPSLQRPPLSATSLPVLQGPSPAANRPASSPPPLPPATKPNTAAAAPGATPRRGSLVNILA